MLLLDESSKRSPAASEMTTLSNGTLSLNGGHHLAMAQAVLIKRPNSHQFQERRFQVESPAKIGRAVQKCKPAAENAIFDCKVLSRNHACLWFDSGKVGDAFATLSSLLTHLANPPFFALATVLFARHWQL